MFRIKICGITNPADAVAAVDAGADAIGLNFYSGSKRCIDSQAARQIAESVAGRCLRVGVFIDHSCDELNSVAAQTQLDAVQLHGDQRPDYLIGIKAHYPIVRVYRIGATGFIRMKADLVACAQLGRSPQAVLIDALSGTDYGGTGQRLDWSTLADRSEILNFDLAEPVHLVLAGGLTPENVYKAIVRTRPAAVDVASGVESSPRQKDPAKVREFVAAARRGFAEIGRE